MYVGNEFLCTRVYKSAGWKARYITPRDIVYETGAAWAKKKTVPCFELEAPFVRTRDRDHYCSMLPTTPSLESPSKSIYAGTTRVPSCFDLFVKTSQHCSSRDVYDFAVAIQVSRPASYEHNSLKPSATLLSPTPWCLGHNRWRTPTGRCPI